MAAQWRYRAVAAAAFVGLVCVAAALAGFDVTRWGSAEFGDGQFSNVRDVVTVTTTAGASNFQVPGLAPGGSASLSFFCQAGADSALADSASQITESNKTNNAAPITVIGCVG